MNGIENIGMELAHRIPHRIRTRSCFGIRGTDLGSSFVHKNKVYFLFGDTWRSSSSSCTNLTYDSDRDDNGINDDLDSIAYTTDTSAADGLNLIFRVQALLFLILNSVFNVPVEGFSINNIMYVYFSTDAYCNYDTLATGL